MAASTLTTNQILGVNDYLTSPNALFCAVMQGDGNFVIYTGSKPFTPQSFPVWATNTSQAQGSFFCIMQDDGNFVVYQGTGVKKQGPAVWAWTNTPPGPGQYFLSLGDEGQLSVTSGTPTNPGTVLWSTPAISGILATNQTLTQGQYLTSSNSKFFVTMQTDGNFVAYNGSAPSNQGSSVWATNILKSGGLFYALMQGDGNFVVYAGTPPSTVDPIWASDTNWANGQYWFVMGNDGYLYVITNGKPGVSYNVYWTTNPDIHPKPPNSGGGGGWEIAIRVLIGIISEILTGGE